MAKNGTYPQQIKNKINEVRELTVLVTKQQAADAAIIALNECFHFGKERSVRFFEAFHRTFQEIARLTTEDAKSDREITYTKEIIDRRLREILGENFVPWEERYSW